MKIILTGRGCGLSQQTFRHTRDNSNSSGWHMTGQQLSPSRTKQAVTSSCNCFLFVMLSSYQDCNQSRTELLEVESLSSGGPVQLLCTNACRLAIPIHRTSNCLQNKTVQGNGPRFPVTCLKSWSCHCTHQENRAVEVQLHSSFILELDGSEWSHIPATLAPAEPWVCTEQADGWALELVWTFESQLIKPSLWLNQYTAYASPAPHTCTNLLVLYYMYWDCKIFILKEFCYIETWYHNPKTYMGHNYLHLLHRQFSLYISIE